MTQFTGTYEQAVRDFVKAMPRGSARKQAARAMLAEIDRLRGCLAGDQYTVHVGHGDPFPERLIQKAIDQASEGAA